MGLFIGAVLMGSALPGLLVLTLSPQFHVDAAQFVVGACVAALSLSLRPPTGPTALSTLASKGVSR